MRLFRIKDDGSARRAADGVLGTRSAVRFVVEDRNGRRVTSYIARVGDEMITIYSNTERVR